MPLLAGDTRQEFCGLGGLRIHGGMAGTTQVLVLRHDIMSGDVACPPP
jgi:hypothetical protein